MTTVKNPITVMKRYEIKYILDPEQCRYFKDAIKGHMKEDEFGITSIASLYYDTTDHRLIANSIMKPPFKEKIRLRSYGLATDDSPVFLELKRKASGIVYKRRVESTIPMVKDFFDGSDEMCCGGQINHELEYFRDYYKRLVPSCLIIYDRIAYFQPDGDIRMTIDHDPRFREDDLDLRVSMKGESLLPEGFSILEIKVQDAMPLWLCKILSEGKIYKTSFSKYGEAYKRMMTRRYEEASGKKAA